jgi:ribonuclease P protein component
LPRSRRLFRAHDLKAVLQQGHRTRTPRIELFWIPNAVGHPRLGVIVPRYGATAPARNRLRRRLREPARRILPSLTSIDLVIRARREAYAARSRQLALDVEEWARSLGP